MQILVLIMIQIMVQIFWIEGLWIWNNLVFELKVFELNATWWWQACLRRHRLAWRCCQPRPRPKQTGKFVLDWEVMWRLAGFACLVSQKRKSSERIATERLAVSSIQRRTSELTWLDKTKSSNRKSSEEEWKDHHWEVGSFQHTTSHLRTGMAQQNKKKYHQVNDINSWSKKTISGTEMWLSEKSFFYPVDLLSWWFVRTVALHLKICLPRPLGKSTAVKIVFPDGLGNWKFVFPDNLGMWSSQTQCHQPATTHPKDLKIGSHSHFRLENWGDFKEFLPSRSSLRSLVLRIDIKAATHFAAFGRLDGHSRLVLVGIRHSRVVARQTRSLSLLSGIRHSSHGIFTSKVARLQGKAQWLPAWQVFDWEKKN